VWEKEEIAEGKHLKVFFEKRVWERLSEGKKKCTQ